MIPDNPKNVLVIQTASIGDVILSTPVIEKLHASFPEANIDFLLKSGIESLFFNHPFIRRVLIWDKTDKKYQNLFVLIQQVKQNNYDLVINLQRFTSSGLITLFSGAKYTIGFNKNPLSLFFSKRVKHTIGKNQLHETERNLSLLKGIGIEQKFPVKLYASPNEEAKLSQYKTHPYITISPASLWFTKQFPQKKWLEFINKTNSHLYIYLLGSKSDHELCENLIQGSERNNMMNLSGKLSFIESAVLMRDAKMNYVNDSAPMHLASSVNAAVTAIFCSTVPAFGFGPLSEKSFVVEAEEDLKCRPCGLHGKKNCPEGHFDCAMTINIDDLLKPIS